MNANKFTGNVLPYIGYEEAGIKGSATMEEIEKAFHLTYLYISEPNFSEVAFQDWKKNEAKSLAIIQDINREDFLNIISDSLKLLRRFPKGSKALLGLNKIDFERAKSIYSKLFRNPQDLTFLFTGDFKEQEVLDLCRKYLGNLPLPEYPKHSFDQLTLPETLTRPSSTIIPSTKPMELAKVRLVYKPKEDIPDFNWQEEIKVEVLRRSFAALLMRRLRFESTTGGIYQVGVGRYNANQNKDYQTFISFDCKPNDINRLITESQEVASGLTETIMDENLFKNIQTRLLDSYDEPESPNTVLEKIRNFIRYGRTWIEHSDKRHFVKSLTPYDILLTAQNYLSSNPLEFIMWPQ